MSRQQLMAASLCTMILATSNALAQNPIPNPGFENWSGGEPVGWFTSNYIAAGSVTQSPDAHSGNSAIQLQFKEPFPGLGYPGFCQVGEDAVGFGVSERYSAVRGFLKFNPLSDELYYITISLWSEGMLVGAGSLEDSIPAAGYQEFVMPIEYLSEAVPDTVYLSMGLGTNSETYDLGSWLRVDDLEMVSGAPPVCPVTLPGDVNASGGIATSDIIYLVNFALKAGPAPVPCLAVGDANCDGQVGTSDIIYLVNSVLKGGAPPCDVCSIIPGTWSCP